MEGSESGFVQRGYGALFANLIAMKHLDSGQWKDDVAMGEKTFGLGFLEHHIQRRRQSSGTEASTSTQEREPYPLSLWLDVDCGRRISRHKGSGAELGIMEKRRQILYNQISRGG